MDGEAPLIDIRNLVKHFGSVIALSGVSLTVQRGEVMCLLGDNGAGKSTLIKTLSGVHQPTSGQIVIEGQPVVMSGPRDALDRGIATVFQDLAMIPLMSITRNFFMGREVTKGAGPLRRFDVDTANRVAREEMKKIGIDVRDPTQAVGTLSGGERQCVAIARAVYFGAIIFGMVSIGLSYTRFDSDWFQVFLGAMLLLAVLFNNFIRRKVTGER